MPFPILQHQEVQCCGTCEPCLLMMLLSLGINRDALAVAALASVGHHSSSTVRLQRCRVCGCRADCVMVPWQSCGSRAAADMLSS